MENDDGIEDEKIVSNRGREVGGFLLLSMIVIILVLFALIYPKLVSMI